MFKKFSKASLFSFFTIFCLPSFSLHAISLHEAVDKKMVFAIAFWKCHSKSEPLTIEIKSLVNKPLEIELNAGSYFRCINSRAQDMLLIQTYHFTLEPKACTEKNLVVNCMEKNNYGPHMNTAYLLAGPADVRLVNLAKAVALSPGLLNVSQSLVWALADKRSEFYYSRGDSVAYWPALRAIAPYIRLVSNQAVQYAYVPAPRVTYSSRVNISKYLVKTTKLSLLCKDRDGYILKEYFKGKSFSQGYYTSTIGFNEIVLDSSFSVVYQLIDDRGKILWEKSAKNHYMEDAPNGFWHESSWKLKLTQPLKQGQLKIYGPNGEFLKMVKLHKDIPAAKNVSLPYSFSHNLGRLTKLKLVLTDKNGKKIKQTEILEAKSTKREDFITSSNY